ncbi:hypothetical protein, partial [Rhodococcus sp. NJ-530]|uniref:hypothetical protein n=1 Tax=Rhodococcus sp. NJ-530 TaxID=2490853 RepID=UPI001F155C48
MVLPDGGRRQEFQDGVIYVAFQNAVGSALVNGPSATSTTHSAVSPPAAASSATPLKTQ